MKAPPLPPNCPHLHLCNWTGQWPKDLFRFDVGGESIAFGPDRSGNKEDDAALDKWRGVIAAVARCAWLDEAQRRVSKAECSEYRVVGDTVEDCECADAAEAWRVWGETK